MYRRPKITIVGAGNVGTATAIWTAARGLGDVVLVDVVEGVAEGKALDLEHAAPLEGFDVHLSGSKGYAASAGSDVVMIAAGAPRKPGMSRDDLFDLGARVVRDVAGEIARRSPDAFLIMVSNPLDAMTQLLLDSTGFPHRRVFGMGGLLDSARYRAFIAADLGVSVQDVQGMVIGSHGDTMVPLVSCTSVGGIPLRHLLAADRIEAIVARTRQGGAEVVNLLKSGGASIAPGAAIAVMFEALLRDRKRVLPACVRLDGQYGLHGLCLGMPVLLGGEGVEHILELPLEDAEMQALRHSAAVTRQMVDRLGDLTPQTLAQQETSSSK